MEMGLWAGDSLRIWREYFPNARIVGVDITLKRLEGDFPGIDILEGDIMDVNFLQDLIEKYAPFDVVVDDASHFSEQHIYVLGCLWPHIKLGGYYFIEDIGIPHNKMTREFFKRPVIDDLSECKMVQTNTVPNPRDGTISMIGILQKGDTDAIQKSEAEKMDARQRTRDGGEVGEGSKEKETQETA